MFGFPSLFLFSNYFLAARLVDEVLELSDERAL